MSTAPLTTEQKIHRAAIDVFTRKGYDGAKTRDIAKAAGITVATLHYYHRTKDQLFHLVAKESMEEFSAIFYDVFKTGRPLKEKIYAFVEEYTKLFRLKPQMATFCLMESERNIEMFREIVDFRESTRVLEPQLQALAAAGEIRPISTPNFISALVGMTIYPFITKTSMYYAHNLDDEGYEKVLEEQRRMIPEMIIGYLWTK
ncbi:MAG: TetR/AcrR family transcriptional regulator [Bacteroidota bacterium]